MLTYNPNELVNYCENQIPEILSNGIGIIMSRIKKVKNDYLTQPIITINAHVVRGSYFINKPNVAEIRKVELNLIWNFSIPAIYLQMSDFKGFFNIMYEACKYFFRNHFGDFFENIDVEPVDLSEMKSFRGSVKVTMH